MKQFGSHIKIDRTQRSHLKFCKKADTFTPDQGSLFIGASDILTGDKTKLSRVDYVDPNIQVTWQNNYPAINRFNGLDVDEDFNMYALSADLGGTGEWLTKLDMDGNLLYQQELSIFSADAMCYGNNKIYVLGQITNDGRKYLFVIDKSTGAILETSSELGPTSVSGPETFQYNKENNRIYFPSTSSMKSVSADSPYGVINYGVQTTGGVAVGNFHIDFFGDIYFSYFLTTSSKRFLKKDKDLNTIWSVDINKSGGSPNYLVSTDMNTDIYCAYSPSDQGRLFKIITDDDGLNPVVDWDVIMHSDLTNSPAISSIQSERKMGVNGRIFTLHGVSGGLRSVRRDGTDIIAYSSLGVNPDLGSEAHMVLLPGKLGTVK